MEISLVIPAYNEEAFIGVCLENAIKNSNGQLKEIIVVDNASTDRTAEIASSYPGVRVIHESRQGTSHARQTGAEEAKGEIIAYTDADTRMHAGWVETIRDTFAHYPHVVFLSGPYRYYESIRYPRWILNTMWWIFVPPVYWMVGFVGNGGNCAVRRDALLKVGGNDRSIAFYGDDTDLARRLHQVGTTLWRNNFYMYTSARRFDETGLVKLCIIYMLNYWWPVLFHRPYTTGTQFNKAQGGAQEK